MSRRICKIGLAVWTLLALLVPLFAQAAQPTLADYQESNFTDLGTTETTPTVTWSAGDLIVVLGITEDNPRTLNTPTATGLTFSAVSGSPTNSASSTKGYAWTATAGSGGSGAVSATGTDHAEGIAVFVFSGTDGLGGTAISAGLGSTTTQDLTRTGTNSHVVQIWGDWNAVNDTTVTWTPTGATQRENTYVAGRATFFVANWGDQGSTGTTGYGFSGYAGGHMTAITLEIKGTSGGAAAVTRMLLGVGP